MRRKTKQERVKNRQRHEESDCSMSINDLSSEEENDNKKKKNHSVKLTDGNVELALFSKHEKNKSGRSGRGVHWNYDAGDIEDR